MFVWLVERDRRARRTRLILEQRAEHDVSIDVFFTWVVKCAGQGADDFEAELLPKTDCSRIRRDNEIELHGAKSESTRLGQAMLRHSASYSSTLGTSWDHESGVGDVRPGTRLIRPQNISADNAGIVFCDVSMSIGSEPISQGLLARHLRVKRVGIARQDDLMKNIPNRVVIRVSCWTYLHGRDRNNANRLPNFSG
jgi:hypothetical protein